MSEPTEPPVPADSHQQFEILMMGHLDGELDREQDEAFRQHLQVCASCAREIVQYRELGDIASSLRLREPQDHELDRFWQALYNRMERRTGWLLLVGGVVLCTLALVVEIIRTELLAWWVKAGVLCVSSGFVVLFISVLRARLRTLPFDRYREVQR